MKYLFLTLVIALAAFSSKAQGPQLTIQNNTGFNWLYEMIAEAIQPSGPNLYFRSGQYSLGSGGSPIVYSTPAQVPFWIGPGGNLTGSQLPANVQWTAVRVYTPYLPTGNPGTNGIMLSTGFTGGSFTPSQNVPVISQCPGNTSTQLTGTMQLNPGSVDITVQ